MTDRKRQIERLFKQHYRAMFRLASIILHDDEESMHVYLGRNTVYPVITIRLADRIL